VLASAHSVRRFIEYTGDLVLATGGAVTRPATGNWTAVFPLSVEAGLDGVPIVLFLDFLVGFVMGYQSARQLEMYGANVFVADVVGLSVTRELGPLVTGIIIVGRSGAAFAAEIGTMKVSEELDALRTMGLSPSRYLVLPRVLALVIVAPILTLLGDVVGVAGGAVVGAISLGVSPGAFASELRNAVVIKDVTGGLIKSAFFGLAIALVACQQGLATRGGATGVGRRTTSTVVVCLFAIVIIDAIFAVIFRVMGQ
jgi:phospholipid/cholesterol/gamma-HCH transport system permease protein